MQPGGMKRRFFSSRGFFDRGIGGLKLVVSGKWPENNFLSISLTANVVLLNNLNKIPTKPSRSSGFTASDDDEVEKIYTE